MWLKGQGGNSDITYGLPLQPVVPQVTDGAGKVTGRGLQQRGKGLFS
jgi:hypothetical protein